MPQVQVPAYTKVTLVINRAKRGFKETYAINDLPGNFFSGSQAIGKKIAQFRQWLLPSSCIIQNVIMSYAPGTRISLNAIDSPLIGSAATITAPQADDVNTIEDCISWRFDGSTGQRATRSFRGIPDGLIVASAFTIAAPGGGWIVSPPTVTDPTVVPATYQAALSNFLSYVFSVCSLPSKRQNVVIAGVTQLGYNLDSYFKATFNGASRHDTGRPSDLVRGRRSAA